MMTDPDVSRLATFFPPLPRRMCQLRLEGLTVAIAPLNSISCSGPATANYRQFHQSLNSSAAWSLLN